MLGATLFNASPRGSAMSHALRSPLLPARAGTAGAGLRADRLDARQDQAERHHDARLPRVVDPVLVPRRQGPADRLRLSRSARRSPTTSRRATGRSDLKKQYQAVTSANRIPLLQNGTIDIECGSTTNNSERAKQVQFAINYFYTGTRFLVKAGTKVDKLADLAGKTGRLDHRHDQLPDHPPPQRRAEARHRPARRQGPRRIGADGADRPRRRLRAWTTSCSTA